MGSFLLFEAYRGYTHIDIIQIYLHIGRAVYIHLIITGYLVSTDGSGGFFRLLGRCRYYYLIHRYINVGHCFSHLNKLSHRFIALCLSYQLVQTIFQFYWLTDIHFLTINKNFCIAWLYGKDNSACFRFLRFYITYVQCYLLIPLYGYWLCYINSTCRNMHVIASFGHYQHHILCDFLNHSLPHLYPAPF